ncbi:uncharacterized protein LOC142154248 isoform X2 [Mixophyes fleayi]|uniref:uncharacterized protein LOC142154248 isoform X2 n=1 Tax=Mixophyes fleayi TaxID=3061075 RepID=UPI003F4D967E
MVLYPDDLVISPRRLRDREALKRKREEAQDKDTFQRDFGSQRQKRARGTARGRRKQAKELEPEPQPEHKLEPTHEPELEVEHVPEQEAQEDPQNEQKSELVPDVLQEQYQHGQQPLEHQDPLPNVIEDEAATIVIHEEAGGRLPEESTSFLKGGYAPVSKLDTAPTNALQPDGLFQDKIEVGEADPEPATAVPDVLSFSLHPEEEEHQYYTPLL